MAWSKDNSRAAKLAAEEALAQAQRAESGADYIAEVSPKIDEFVGEQTNLQTQLNDLVLQSGTDIAEVVQARGGEVTLNERLNKTTAQLAEKAQQADLDTTKNTVALKADKTEVNSLANAKADKTYVDTNISTLNTKINSQASGSPKATYATLSALQAAFPTGNANIYVVTADGKWYYWNGSAWTVGGTYQSTGIAEKSISPKETTFIKESTNLFDKSRVLRGTSIDGSTGLTIVSPTLSSTDYYIKVELGKNYYMKGITRYAIYDANMNLTRSFSISPSTVNSISISGADVYLKLVAFTTDLDIAQINVGSSLLPYEEFYVKLNGVGVNTENLENESLTTEKYAGGSITQEKLDHELTNKLPKSINTFPAIPNYLDEGRMMITDFSSGWGSTFSSGSTDTVNTFKGRNTFKVTKPSGQGGIRAHTTSTLTLNLSEYDYLEWWFHTDRFVEFTNVAAIELQSGTDNKFVANIHRHLTPLSLKHGTGYFGWRRIRINKADFLKTGTPEWSNITSINIIFALDLNAQLEISLAQMDAVKMKKGAISIDFDDGLKSSYEVGLPILSKHGLTATQYVITSIVGSAGYCTWNELKEMKDAGWLIGNHSHTHRYLGDLTKEEVEYEFNESNKLLRQHGFYTGSYFIAAPYGSWSPIVTDVAKSRFIYTRSGRDYPNYSAYPLNDLTLARSHGTTRDTTFEDLKILADEAIINKRWMVVLFHGVAKIGEVSPGMYDIKAEVLEQFCEYVAQKQAEGLVEALNTEEAVLSYKGLEIDTGNGHGVMSIGDNGEPVTIKLKPNSQYLY